MMKDQQQLPTMAPSALARMICDPIEYHDLDWAAYQAANGAGCSVRGQEALPEGTPIQISLNVDAE